MLNIAEIIENNNDIEVIPENLDVSYFNKIFNSRLNSILIKNNNNSINLDTNKILINILNQKVWKNNMNYNISREIIFALESWKSLDDSIDTEEKIELYESMKKYYLAVKSDKLLMYKWLLWEDFVNSLINFCNHKFFHEVDNMAFDCDMWIEELDEFVMFMDSIDEINFNFKKLEDLFVKNLSKKIPIIINRIKKNPKGSQKIINEFLFNLWESWSSVTKKTTFSYLNWFLTKLYDSLYILYYFFILKWLLDNDMGKMFDVIIANNSNKYINLTESLYDYVFKYEEFRVNVDKQYAKIPDLENINIYDLEKKVREQWIIKKIKPQIINLWEMSFKIIAHDWNNVKDNYSHIFTVWINFEWENKFGLFRATDVNSNLLSNIQSLTNSLFVTINSFWEVSIWWSKKSLDFLKWYDLKLRKIILYVVLEYLKNQEEFLESFFLNDSDFKKYINNESVEIDDLDDTEDIDTNMVEVLDIDQNEEIRNLDNEYENIDEKNKNRIREAFLTVKAFPVDKIFNKFVKILWEPVRKSNWSHFTFHSPRTWKRYVFAKHWSRWTNNIWEWLLKKYFINYWICPTELL